MYLGYVFFGHKVGGEEDGSISADINEKRSRRRLRDSVFIVHVSVNGSENVFTESLGDTTGSRNECLPSGDVRVDWNEVVGRHSGRDQAEGYMCVAHDMRVKRYVSGQKIPSW